MLYSPPNVFDCDNVVVAARAGRDIFPVLLIAERADDLLTLTGFATRVTDVAVVRAGVRADWTRETVSD